jgi:tetratricopeptide (TPR) repeat protein/DNA-binding CsgD family transcriptional regulator
MRLKISYVFILFFNFLFISAQSEADDHRAKQEEYFKQIFAQPEEAAKNLRALLKEEGKVHDTLVAISWNMMGVYFAVTHQTDSSLYAFNRSLDLFPVDYHRVPGIMANKAIVYKNRGDLDNAFSILNEALVIAKAHNNLQTQSTIYGEMASSHRQNKQLNLAITYLIKSIEILESLDNVRPSVLASEKQKLANTYLETQNYDFAKRLFEEVLPVFKRENIMSNYYITLVNYADCLLYENETEKALEILEEAKAGLEGIGNLDLVSFAAHKMAHAYQKTGNNQQAEFYLEKASQMALEQKSIRTLYVVSEYISFLNDRARFQEADELAIQTLNSGLSETAPLDFQIQFYQKLSEIKKAQDSIETALFYNEKVIVLKDSLQTIYDKSTSLDLQAKYQNQIQHQENLILSQKISIQNRNIYILLGLVVLSLFLVFFILRVNRLKSTLRTIALEKKESEARELEAKFNHQKDLNDIKERTIEKQKNELLATALEKIELNEKLENIIQEAESTGDNKLKSQLENLKKHNKYWETLISKFYNLHPEFVKNIKSEFPELTKSEVDFCSLIKMNFSFKEIASILQISHDSVISKKYRISKKIKISGDIDFYTIINRF